MKASTLLLFQFGHAGAIRRVAESRAAPWIGMILVLITAVPRSYDQTYILDTVLWLPGPLLFSSVSGFWFFLCIRPFLNKPREGAEQPVPSFRYHLWRFLGLFWMTAPIAWLYALPVERFLGPVDAARANIFLLAVVALWRVLLFSRLLAVLHQVPFGRALGWIAIPAGLEVVVLAVFSPIFSVRILAGMSGMLNSPEENLLLGALQTAFLVGLAGLVVGAVLYIAYSARPATPLPRCTTTSVPYLPLLGAGIVWAVIAVAPQMELQRNAHVRDLLAGKHYAEVIEFLSQHRPEDFSPSLRIAPDPYSYRVWDELPALFERMDGTEAAWVRSLYLEYFGILFQHRIGMHLDVFARVLGSLERLPEGKAWMKAHRQFLQALDAEVSRHTPVNDEHERKLNQLRKQLHSLGVGGVSTGS